MSTFSMRGN